MEYGPSRHRQHSRSSPCGRDWHRPTESSTSSIIQNHPAAMGGRSLTGPPFFVAARKFVEEIGRASCRERVCQYVSISVVAVTLKKKNNTKKNNIKHPAIYT